MYRLRGAVDVENRECTPSMADDESVGHVCVVDRLHGSGACAVYINRTHHSCDLWKFWTIYISKVVFRHYRSARPVH